VIAFVWWMAFAFSLLQCVSVTENRRRGELTAGPWEWFWIGLLPVWLLVLFRYYSICRPGCRA